MYTIYHIPGLKVGCTANLERRIEFYKKEIREKIEVLEVLPSGTTPQEAGDVERAWADTFGYHRGSHYAVIKFGFKGLTSEQQSELGKKGSARAKELGVGIFALTPERRIEIGRNAPRELRQKAGRIGGKNSRKNMTAEQASELARKSASHISFATHSKNGRKTGRLINELGISGMKVRASCIHCGVETNIANLKRWHFDNCPKLTSEGAK